MGRYQVRLVCLGLGAYEPQPPGSGIEARTAKERPRAGYRGCGPGPRRLDRRGDSGDAPADDQHVGFCAHKPSSRHACDSVRKRASAGNPRCAARAKKCTDGRIARASGANMRCRWGPGVCACASNLDAPRSARYAPRCEAARPCDIRVARTFGLAASAPRGLRNQSPVAHRFCRASLETHLRTHATARHLRLRRLCGGRAQRGGMGYSLLNVHTE